NSPRHGDSRHLFRERALSRSPTRSLPSAPHATASHVTARSPAARHVLVGGEVARWSVSKLAKSRQVPPARAYVPVDAARPGALLGSARATDRLGGAAPSRFHRG